MGGLRFNFSIQHLLAAAHFSRHVSELERAHTGELFGALVDAAAPGAMTALPPPFEPAWMVTAPAIVPLPPRMAQKFLTGLADGLAPWTVTAPLPVADPDVLFARSSPLATVVGPA